MAGERVTLKDIAQAAGCSINTVSRALKDMPDIAPATRARIQQLAGQMGYLQNHLASALRSGSSHTIAVVLGDVSNPHFSLMVQDIERFFRGKGYTVVIICTHEDPALEREALGAALSRQVDGIALCPCQIDRSSVALLERSGVPFVLVGRHFSDPALNSVHVDDTLGGYLATRHLLDLGHRRILHLMGPEHVSSGAERRDGYLRALAEVGVAPQAHLMVEVPGLNLEAVASCLDAAGVPGVDYTALFAFSDAVAWGALNALRPRHIHIPRDLSVIGFDHIAQGWGFMRPIATIAGGERMATQAAALLLSRIQDRDQPPRQIVLPPALVPGPTTAPPAG